MTSISHWPPLCVWSVLSNNWSMKDTPQILPLFMILHYYAQFGIHYDILYVFQTPNIYMHISVTTLIKNYTPASQIISCWKTIETSVYFRASNYPGVLTFNLLLVLSMQYTKCKLISLSLLTENSWIKFA